MATPAVPLLFMPIFQTEILSASDVCSNCFARQRREAIKPTASAWRDDETYSERCRWQTAVEDVPGPVVHDAGQLFCDCGADGAFTRIWDSRDVGIERRKALIFAAAETLQAKGYRVDERRFAQAVVDELPPADIHGPFESDIVNEAFKHAAETDAVVAIPDATPEAARP